MWNDNSEGEGRVTLFAVASVSFFLFFANVISFVFLFTKSVELWVHLRSWALGKPRSTLLACSPNIPCAFVTGCTHANHRQISQQFHFCFVQNLEISVASNLGKSWQSEQNLSDMIPEFHSSPFACILSLVSTVISKCNMRKKHCGLQICVSFVLRNGAYNPEATDFALYVFHA